ncbi:hypothetical protein GS399_20315 [Pedobacter sp. HMF7647]|uniref:Uncharacterized protein n=1 Tax=Hufsiella arboris TaxID=2695275 RepID=A0A7K1YFD9_9SPHI|nr:hypothetical protein [Hufsiella arboris]MXV53316.1 hypothetical protein [Hufsiella arboris]
MRKLFIQGFAFSCFALFAFNGCKKDSSSTGSDQDITTVEVSAEADELMMDSFSEISGVSTENPGMFGLNNSSPTIKSAPNSTFGDCVSIAVSPLSGWPKTLTLDFGQGCTLNGVKRSGKITAVFTAPIFTTGAKVSLAFDNYTVNGTKVEGTKIYTNNGKNAAGNYSYTVDVTGAKFTKDSKSFTWNCNRTIEWTKGFGTVTAADDEFSITGTANGTTPGGQNFTVATNSALIKKTACNFISAGILELKSAGKTWTLDYGSGDCDDQATVTGASFTRQITLKK